jgi:hypothetical protein
LDVPCSAFRPRAILTVEIPFVPRYHTFGIATRMTGPLQRESLHGAGRSHRHPRNS